MCHDEVYANGGLICQKHLEVDRQVCHALVAAGETSFHIQQCRVLICWYNALCSCITLCSKITNQLGRLCQCFHEAKTSG